MAKAIPDVIQALRKAADKLESSTHYQWGHMGSCNCGFLAQVVTEYPRQEIHRRAMLGCGDWSEQLRDYCPVSGLPFDEVISELIGIGFDPDDLMHLEKLSDPKILREFPIERRNLSYNLKAHVVTYMRAWVRLLEDELLDLIRLPGFETEQGNGNFKSESQTLLSSAIDQEVTPRRA